MIEEVKEYFLKEMKNAIPEIAAMYAKAYKDLCEAELMEKDARTAETDN